MRMAGFHFSCGEWLGEDKSADQFFEIAMDELSLYLLPGERETWSREVEPFFWEPPGESDNQIHIPFAIIRLLVEPARRYRVELAKRLGLSGPEAAVDEIASFPADRGSDEYRYRCLADLIRGFEESSRTGQPVKVTFC